ncbi:MlaA family lipoprotein [Pseudoduganella namucuonensis]|uniref:Phospholipid-binding lipoprotein MlaA n=1 Tax=Pseudoduganella namucuonensis TaxID=1035707 RepID=A0A1I7L2K9_9BURK|nr:VacJ family lipoprotein [Pseudoduganella namucuonensis]SFV03734.1 phospholipid-binding lipoprotein MlaA [Pseudoduganella namucuonensis]
MRATTPLRSLALAATAAAVLTGCAGPNPRDPYEGFNRAMFKFNDKVDQVALKPAATAYKTVLPGFVQTGVNNFFGNMSDVWTAANNFMQGKGEQGMTDVMRVALNSTFGLLGVLDIASEAGLQKHNEDFGQTLGHWGVDSGPYLMLPLLGPSTVRDTAGLPLDIAADPWRKVTPDAARNWGVAVRGVDQRAVLLDASNLMEEAALDRYEFVRDGFLQRRQSKVYDGEDGPRGKAKKAYADDDLPPTAAADKGAEPAPAASPAASPAIMTAPAADKNASL